MTHLVSNILQWFSLMFLVLAMSVFFFLLLGNYGMSTERGILYLEVIMLLLAAIAFAILDIMLQLHNEDRS